VVSLDAFASGAFGSLHVDLTDMIRNTAYLPISTSQVYDRFGEAYNITRVLDKVSLRLNVTAYHECELLPVTSSSYTLTS
jgi:hypothetical protein